MQSTRSGGASASRPKQYACLSPRRRSTSTSLPTWNWRSGSCASAAGPSPRPGAVAPLVGWLGVKIATFNVNGINGRLPRLLEWIEESEPDIACLQELKTTDDKFPAK